MRVSFCLQLHAHAFDTASLDEENTEELLNVILNQLCLLVLRRSLYQAFLSYVSLMLPGGKGDLT